MREQTNGGGSGWSIEGCEKYDELFMAVKADRKQNAKQFNPQLRLFQACRRRKQLAKHNAKDDARPRAKVAFHRMNELEDDDSDEEASAHENTELSDNENNSDGENYNVHRPMNVFALQWTLTFGVPKGARSQQRVVDTKQFNKSNYTHARNFVNQVPKTSSYNSLVLG